MCCYLTRTTKETHQLIKENLHETPTYGGWVEAKGPRYCPSIEDKVRLVVYVILSSCIRPFFFHFKF
jgi:tRNA U34 5-carboxymethylaminomethyl modifying enzyme MnmG/GidA